jgi:hypothetical protein
MIRRLRRPLIIAASCLLGVALLGLRLLDVVLVGLVAFVLAAVATSIREPTQNAWPAAGPEEPDGARGEVYALTWSFVGRDGRVSEVAVRRLRADAARRLAKLRVVIPGGLNAATPRSADPAVVERAQALLGDRAWATLTAPGGLMPSILDVAHCVDVIENLGEPAPGTPPVRSPRSSRLRGL